jgi:hypothetical protein
MIPLPASTTNLELAKRINWFEPPEVVLGDPQRFLTYAFRYATIDDIDTLYAHFSKADLVLALINAPPGIIDPRSWAYWNLILRDLSPPPPMPTRTFLDETQP